VLTVRYPPTFLALGVFAVAPACTHQDVTGSGASIHITVSTTGEEPDADGYTVQLDGRSAKPIASGILAQDVAAGDHTIYLGGVADNCTVRGANPRVITVPAEGAAVLIEVVCAARTGSVLVSTRSRGPLPNPSGHSITIDDTKHATLDTGIVLIQGVTRGMRLVELRGVAAHCRVDGNPRGVIVRPGETANVEFPVICIGQRGTLQITTEPSGQWNPNGYLFSLDGGRARRIGTSAVLTLNDLITGFHQVELLDIPRNCTVLGKNPVTVNVSAGSPASIRFQVFCNTSPPGAMRVSVTTAGIPVEPSYDLMVNGNLEHQVPANGEITIPDLQPDTYIVELVHSPGCSVDGENPRNVVVRPAISTKFKFMVTCPAGG